VAFHDETHVDAIIRRTGEPDRRVVSVLDVGVHEGRLRRTDVVGIFPATADPTRCQRRRTRVIEQRAPPASCGRAGAAGHGCQLSQSSGTAARRYRQSARRVSAGRLSFRPADVAGIDDETSEGGRNL
jgi:hypothetical protein